MAEQLKKVHYFPGHMKKALGRLEPYVKMADAIIELCDARAPISSRNPYLAEATKGKRRALIFSKSDLADLSVTSEWMSKFKDEDLPTLSIDLKKEKLIKELGKLFEKEIAIKREKESRLGMKKQPLRLLIVGIPNVGKSSLINNLVGRKAAIVGNKPGVTRGEQWIKISDDFLTLDTPGILPMNYLDEGQAVNLALLGSMRQEVMPTDDLAGRLLSFLKENYPYTLLNRYGIGDLHDIGAEEALEMIGRKKGYLLPEGKVDLDKSALILLKEFADGLLGRCSLEKP